MCNVCRFGINLSSHRSFQNGEKIISAEWEKIIVDLLDNNEDFFVDFDEFGIENESDIIQLEEEEFETFQLAKTKKDSSSKIQSLYRYVSNDLSGYGYSHVGSNTRPFCERLVNRTNRKFLTRQAIEALNNSNPGQGPNGSDQYDILSWRGGRNCRHIFVKYYYNADTKSMVKAPESQQPRQVIRNGGVPGLPESKKGKPTTRKGKGKGLFK